MSLPSIDFQCEIDQEADQAYHHGHPLVDLYQSQAHIFPHIPPTSDWGWNEGARPGLTSAPSSQNLVASSWVMPIVGESTAWDAPPSTYGVYGTLTGIQHHATNTGLAHLPNGTAVTLSHAGHLSSLSSRMEPPSQENFEQDICNHDVHHPVVRSERQAHSQITNKNTRRPQLYVCLNSIDSSPEQTAFYGVHSLPYFSVDR